MRYLVIVSFMVVALTWTGGKLFAAEAQQPAFKTEEGKKAFEAAKAAFAAKNYNEAKKQLNIAAKQAANKAAKQEVRRYINGLKGLRELLILDQKKNTHGGWVYENAQRKYLVHFVDPSGALFRRLLDELESPERKLVTKIETFETHGPYSVRFGKTFVHKIKAPQFVVEGQRSLKWVCKDRNCRVLKIPHVPKDWSSYDYLAFWLYEAKGKGSTLQLSIVTSTPRKKGRRNIQRSFRGFQGQLPPHQGWKFIVVRLRGGKILRKIRGGDLKNVGYIHFQLPTVKPFEAYIDNVVLVRKN